MERKKKNDQDWEEWDIIIIIMTLWWLCCFYVGLSNEKLQLSDGVITLNLIQF